VAKTSPAEPQPVPEEKTLDSIWLQAVLHNTVKTLDPWYGSSGFRPHHARFRSSTFDNGPRLAETFLLNTRLQRHDRETSASVMHYFTDEAKAMLSLNGIEANPTTSAVALPPSIELSLRFGKCLKLRRSRRLFTGDSMPLAALATLIRAAAGVTGSGRAQIQGKKRETPLFVDIEFRSAPSPGGLFGLDLFVVAQAVRGTEPGLYLYQPHTDQLLLMRTEKTDKIIRRIHDASAYPDTTIANSRAAAIFLLAARPWKLLRKYGDRGLRYLFIEAGEMTQNIHLAAVALGYGSVESASFYDDEMNDALELDGGTRTVVHMIFVGLPANV
jgi:SagB-type dehydrogenase family enzyme